jgi:inhibitor of growth protein 4
LESLPLELTRNFKIIHDLDVKVQEILVEIDALKTAYLAEFKQLDTETRANRMKAVNKKHEKCKQLSDEKVQLANQTYELVRLF